jgi:glycosyltransferase involved in cell wall biosynthesis
MTTISTTHLVLIPSYNTGARVFQTVRDARQYWQPVWVIIDGSDDGTGEELQRLADADQGLRILRLPENRGKGSAVLHGLREAGQRGFTHALTMDADGQHAAASIPEFMAASIAHPEALILGVPIFDADAPSLRVKGRRISNWWANLETLWAGISDSLFGLRVYPIAPLQSIMESHRWMRRFDFDPEAVVRLCWRGLHPINIPAPVRYFTAAQGGVSHFRYLRDNVLLTWMHTRLMFGFLVRLPMLFARRFRPSRR